MTLLYDDVLRVLDVRQGPDAAGESLAICPAHEDHKPSLSIRRGDDPNKAVFHCLAGCTRERVIAALRTLGVGAGLKTLRRTPGKSNKRTPATARPAGAISKPFAPDPLPDQDTPYEYHAELIARRDENYEFLTEERGLVPTTIEHFKIGTVGDRIAFPVRVQGKWRNIRKLKARAKPEDKWRGVAGHNQVILYASEHLAGNTLPILLCEGELDMVLAWQKDNERPEPAYVALTATGGAGNVPKDLARLAGRAVFIAYDCDEAGVAGAAKVAEALAAVGATAHILDLTRLGLPANSKQDVTDFFLRHGGTVDKLLAEMERLRDEADDTLPERFKPVSAAELAQPVPRMEWLVKGVWPEGSYGTLAGEKKTLKTYTDLALALAVASGEPFLGKFPVPRPRPVLMYLGEGGQIPTMHRLQRLARAMDVDLPSLPLRIVFDAGDMTGTAFLGALAKAVAEEMPGLVIVDPFYAFHPSGVEAQNLYDRGAMLAGVRASMPPGCAFILADHFRKTGNKQLDLDSIAQSGVAQWADSWVLQNHHSPPLVDEGKFAIGVQFGSRQWGGRQYFVDWSLGTFNVDTGEHEGDLTFAVTAVGWGDRPATETRTDDRVAAHILTLLGDEPLVHTMTSAREIVTDRASVGKGRFDEVWGLLVANEDIVSEKALGNEGRLRDRWRPETTPSAKVHIGQTEAEK